MPFKIPETEQERLGEGAEELQELRSKLEDGLWAYNQTVKASREKLQQLVEPYEEKAREMYAILENIKSAAEEDYDGMSDDWKDTDAGEATKDWIDALDEAMTSLDVPLNLPEVEELDAESVLAEDLSEIIQGIDPEPNA
ncbi:MAG TPA: hypothetical protein VJ652_01535 [Noviherbaspirillum sp.]|nr:hypothetical protein [Noviherbaspirillum sp.]